MKHEDLIKMSVKDLEKHIAGLVEQSKTAEGEALNAIVAEVEDAKGIIADAKTRAQLQTMAAVADPDENEDGDEGKAGETGEANAKTKAFAERGAAAKAGKAVKYSTFPVLLIALRQFHLTAAKLTTAASLSLTAAAEM